MSELDRVLSDAVAAEHVPFVVAMTGNAAGVTWSGAAGDRSPGQKADVDTVMRIFSMTKAVGCTAAMILMDRGKLSPDAEVSSILPRFAELQVLDGFDADGKPRMRAPRTQATVRHLATHTSGLAYEFWNEDMPRFMQATGAPSILSGLAKALELPAAVRPGTRWDYGIGIDWLGQVVEKVDGRRIDQFCREEIFEPLGMRDTRFEPEADIAPRLAAVAIRGEDGHFAPFELAPPPNPEVYGMGHCLYSTAPDYMRFLRMYLNKGELDGQRVLSQGGRAVDAGQPDRHHRDPAAQDHGAADHRRCRVLPRQAQVAEHGVPAHRRRRAGHALGGLAVLGRRVQHALLVRPGQERGRGAS